MPIADAGTRLAFWQTTRKRRRVLLRARLGPVPAPSVCCGVLIDMSEHKDQGGKPPAEGERQPERAVELFGRAVRTALRNNATAYGFSISITAAYGLANAVAGPAKPLETISFAAGAAIAFVVIGAVFLTQFRGSLPEGGQVATISGGVDLLSIIGAVATALGLSQIPGYLTWPVTAFGAVSVYLLVGGLDVLIARGMAQRTSFARRQ